MRIMHGRTAKGFAAAVIAAGIATGVAGAAAGSPASTASTSYHQKVITATTTTVQFAVIDVGTPGPALSLGDQIVSSDAVSINGKQVGTDGVVCTVVKATATALTCQWTMTMELPGGQLTFQGIADGPTGPPTSPVAFTLAVTGGTGQYRNAAGTADIVDSPGGVEKITIHLSR